MTKDGLAAVRRLDTLLLLYKAVGNCDRCCMCHVLLWLLWTEFTSVNPSALDC